MSIFVAAAACTVALAGLVLLVQGIVPRRRGDASVCAACGFDLRGRPVDAAACPECGADLSLPRAVARGRRRRRPTRIALGLVLVLLGGGTYVLHSTNRLGLADRPSRWIAEVEMRFAGPARRVVLLEELVARTRAGRLADAPLRTVARLGLDEQARLHAEAIRERDGGTFDPDLAQARWPGAWGDLIHEALARGLLGEEERRDFVRHAMVATAFAEPSTVAGRLRPRVRLQHPFGRSATASPDRTVGGIATSGPRLELVLRSIELSGTVVHETPGGRMTLDAKGRQGGWSGTGLTSIPAGVPPGEHEGRVVLELSVLAGVPGSERRVESSWTEALPLRATVPAVDVAVPVAAVRAAFLRPFEGRSIAATPAAEGWELELTGGPRGADHPFRGGPMPVLRLQGREVRASTAGSRGHGADREDFFRWWLDAEPPARVDVDFLPFGDLVVNPPGVAGFTGPADLGPGVLVLRGVPVERREP